MGRPRASEVALETEQQATDSPVPPTFPASISRKLGRVTLASFLLIVGIGGVSSYLAYSILASNEQIVRNKHHIEVTEAIQASILHLIREVDRAVIRRTLDREFRIRALSRQPADMVAVFLGEHLADKDVFPEREQEIALLREILHAVEQLDAAVGPIISSIAADTRVRPAHLQSIDTVADRVPGLVRQLHGIHETKVGRLTAASISRMKVILAAFVAFVFIGGISVIAGIVLFSRTIVLPIRRLAQATQEVARGDFKKRVSVSSRDEIGQLAHSFNVMAERLEAHERSLQTLATLKERERLAREMHDGLAQALGYLHARFGVLEANIAPNTQDDLRDELREMKKVAGEAYEEVRQSIFGLRTMVSRGLGLIPTLTEYLHDFSQQTGIAVDLQTGDERATRFSPDVEVQLVRIIQEALANIRKHAGASCVVVRFDVNGNQCCVLVRDNGRGFELGAILAEGSRHFGLQAMRERAEGIRGTLEIDTALERGTGILVRLPL